MKRGVGEIPDTKLKEEYQSRLFAFQANGSKEFFANLCYHHLGVAVPDSAIYSCVINMEEQVYPAWIHMTRFIEGKQLTQALLDDHKGDSSSPFMTRFRQGVAADVILGNFDVVGKEFANVLIIEDDGPRIIRIDNGGMNLYDTL